MHVPTTGRRAGRFDGHWIARAGLVIILLAGAAWLVRDALPSTGERGAAAPAVTSPAPQFIIGDVDGVYHTQQAALPTEAAPLFIIGDIDSVASSQHASEPVTAGCEADGAPVFISGDSDGLANGTIDAVIQGSTCDDGDR